jgi:phosphatidylglycerophosphatase A
MGFFLFRLFDIWKPWPACWLDKHVHGGLGIMLDDLAAALYAWLGLHILLKIFAF